MNTEELPSQHNRAFIEVLYQNCEGLIELRAIAAGKLPRQEFFTLDDESGIARFIKAHRGDNVFFGVATRNDASSGDLANCRSLTALFADLDFKQIPETEARQRLAGFPQSAIIHSGGGLHVYWLLHEPLNLRNPTDCATARSLLRRLATFLGADMVAAEPARVLRVPDTLNHKYTPPRKVTVELLEPARRYDASEFDAQLPPEPTVVPNGPFVVPEKILDGQRNDTLYRAARSMKARGYSKAAIEAAIHAENSEKCSPPLSSKGVEDIISHATTQADRPEFGRTRVVDHIGALRKMSPDEVKATWMNFSDGLDAVAERELIVEVERLTGIGLRTLTKALSEHKAKVKKEATTSRTGTRMPIEYHPEDVSDMAERAETETLARVNDFELINFAGVLARVAIQKMPYAHQADSDRAPLPTAQIDILTKAKLLPLVERAVVFQKTRENTLVNIAVPDKVLEHILVNSTQIPKVSALVTHPVVTMSGRIVSAIGIDQETGLLLYGSAIEGLRPYPQSEAAAVIVAIAEMFTDGFEFDTPLDRACAIGMLCTALMRKMLETSPGVLITAAQQSVGKTTLAKRVHLILTGRDMPVMTWPEGNETEANKLVFSALLGSAPLLCFDNVGDGLTFKSPTLAAAMTSLIKEDRILGISRVARVPTNTLFVLTGNNIELSNDEVHRWMRIRLKSSDINPHKRRFQHPDVVNHGLQIRDEVIRHCIGIIAGYRQGNEKIEPLSRFPQWDALVRQPLMWAGLDDIGKVFDANIDASPELGAHRALLAGLSQLFGDTEFGARDLTQESGFEKPPVINEALRALHAKDTGNDRSVGHALSKVCGRAVLVEEALSKRVLSLKSRLVSGLTRYRVVERIPADDLVG